MAPANTPACQPRQCRISSDLDPTVLRLAGAYALTEGIDRSQGVRDLVRLGYQEYIKRQDLWGDVNSPSWIVHGLNDTDTDTSRYGVDADVVRAEGTLMCRMSAAEPALSVAVWAFQRGYLIVQTGPENSWTVPGTAATFADALRTGMDRLRALTLQHWNDTGSPLWTSVDGKQRDHVTWPDRLPPGSCAPDLLKGSP